MKTQTIDIGKSCYDFCKYYRRKANQAGLIEDLDQEIKLAIQLALDTFDGSKGDIVHWCMWKSKHACSDFFDRERKLKKAKRRLESAHQPESYTFEPGWEWAPKDWLAGLSDKEVDYLFLPYKTGAQHAARDRATAFLQNRAQAEDWFGASK